MDVYSFVTAVTGPNRPITGKEEHDDNDDDIHIYILLDCCVY
jgi:hypothetical protein